VIAYSKRKRDLPALTTAQIARKRPTTATIDGMGSKKRAKLDNELYEAELTRLQAELVEMQEWMRTEGKRLVVIFEGRDAAGKGGAIKRIMEYLNPRVARIVALPAPTERERTQWYFQRYIEHLPAAGEIRLLDRSWYNRAGVERVMGYCTAAEYQRFLRQCPIFEQMLMEDGIMLRKYWFSVSGKEQQKRFRSRLTDPMRRWKLSPTDLESLTRWEEYSRAKDEMFVHTDLPGNHWRVVEAEDKKRARINMIADLLASVHYEKVNRPDLKLPKRPASTGYRRTERELQHYVADFAAKLESSGEIPEKYVDPEDSDLPALSESKTTVAPEQPLRRTRARTATRAVPQPPEEEAVSEAETSSAEPTH